MQTCGRHRGRPPRLNALPLTIGMSNVSKYVGLTMLVGSESSGSVPCLGGSPSMSMPCPIHMPSSGSTPPDRNAP